MVLGLDHLYELSKVLGHPGLGHGKYNIKGQEYAHPLFSAVLGSGSVPIPAAMQACCPYQKPHHQPHP